MRLNHPSENQAQRYSRTIECEPAPGLVAPAVVADAVEYTVVNAPSSMVIELFAEVTFVRVEPVYEKSVRFVVPVVVLTRFADPK
jgi:hypothetical protein